MLKGEPFQSVTTICKCKFFQVHHYHLYNVQASNSINRVIDTSKTLRNCSPISTTPFYTTETAAACPFVRFIMIASKILDSIIVLVNDQISSSLLETNRLSVLPELRSPSQVRIAQQPEDRTQLAMLEI